MSILARFWRSLAGVAGESTPTDCTVPRDLGARTLGPVSSAIAPFYEASSHTHELWNYYAELGLSGKAGIPAGLASCPIP